MTLQDGYFYARLRRRLPWKNMTLIVRQPYHGVDQVIELQIKDIEMGFSECIDRRKLEEGKITYAIDDAIAKLINRAREHSPWPGMEYTP